MIAEEKKKEVLQKLAKDANLTQYTLNFLNILVDRDRLVNSDSIFKNFEDRYCELTDTQVREAWRLLKFIIKADEKLERNAVSNEPQ